MSVPIQAVQHIRRMRGGAPAHLLRASDNAYHVTKFQSCPQGVKILANEMFATRLGLWLGLPMPRVEVIEVSDWLITHTEDLRVDIGGVTVPCTRGPQFGSRYPCDPALDAWDVFDYLPENLLARVKNVNQFAGCLVLDKWLANSDGRQAVFTRKPRARYFQTLFIDQGYCMNAQEWNFPDSWLRGVYARNCVYAKVTGWESFEPALTRADEADLVDIWRCAEAIPAEWYEHDHQGLERIVETVYDRRGKIRALIEAFRTSSRDPFPNWRVQRRVSSGSIGVNL